MTTMTKDEATRWQKIKAFAIGTIVVDIQTIAAAWVLMLIVGVTHHNLAPALQPASFVSCLILLVLGQILYTLTKFTIDFR